MRIIEITIPEKDQAFWFQVFDDQWELDNLVQGMRAAIAEYCSQKDETNTLAACDWENVRQLPAEICQKHGFLPFHGQPRTYTVSGHPITPETVWRVKGVRWFNSKGYPIESMPTDVLVPGYICNPACGSGCFLTSVRE